LSLRDPPNITASIVHFPASHQECAESGEGGVCKLFSEVESYRPFPGHQQVSSADVSANALSRNLRAWTLQSRFRIVNRPSTACNRFR